MNKKRFYIIFAGFFFLGVITGSIVTLKYVEHRMKMFLESDHQNRRNVFVKTLSRQLQLTQQQQEKFAQIAEEIQQEKMLPLRKKIEPEVEQIFRDAIVRMKKEIPLSKSQEEKLQEVFQRYFLRLKVKQE